MSDDYGKQEQSQTNIWERLPPEHRERVVLRVATLLNRRLRAGDQNDADGTGRNRACQPADSA